MLFWKNADGIIISEDIIETANPNRTAIDLFNRFLNSLNNKKNEIFMVSVNCTDQFLKFEGATLGHLHKPQKICLPTIRYAGSPLKYPISECSTDNISNPCGTI
ncbi:MAG TPA: hypothetical protein O0W88_03985 [Methanocorpusculum sp.]|nr:hypothetical protein [Methanocorpusculum sp.]